MLCLRWLYGYMLYGDMLYGYMLHVICYMSLAHERICALTGRVAGEGRWSRRPWLE